MINAIVRIGVSGLDKDKIEKKLDLSGKIYSAEEKLTPTGAASLATPPKESKPLGNYEIYCFNISEEDLNKKIDDYYKNKSRGL